MDVIVAAEGLAGLFMLTAAVVAGLVVGRTVSVMIKNSREKRDDGGAKGEAGARRDQGKKRRPEGRSSQPGGRTGKDRRRP